VTPGPESPLVVGHRGASRDCPENTFAAFDEAIRQDAGGIELDVQLSRDEIPVVYHDRSLRKAGGGARRVADLDVTELERLDAGRWFGARFRGERIPHLARVLDRYGERVRLLIEIKARGPVDVRRRVARAVAEMVRERQLERQTRLLCFDDEALREATRVAPRCRLVLNLDPPSRMTAAVLARLDGLDALSVDVRSLTPRFADAVREAGLPLYVYTCNSDRTVSRALSAGASAVMSDRPGWLAERIASARGAR
jgi:glycerophosphoryl diester phosphodiesterase